MKTFRLIVLLFICHCSVTKAQYYEWAKTYSAFKGYSINGICTDVSNNILFTSHIAYSFTFQKVAINKIDSLGAPIWNREFPYITGGHLSIGSVTTDYAGNSYAVIRNTDPSFLLDSNLTVTYKQLIVKLSPTGAVLRVDSLPQFPNVDIFADSTGNLYLTDGSSIRKLNKNGNQVWNNTSLSSYKLGIDRQKHVYGFQGDSLFKLSSSGNKLWAKKYNVNDFAVDKTGNIYVTTNDSIYKLNSSGNLQWKNTSFHGSFITLDPAGKIYLRDGTNIYKLNNGGNLLKWSIADGTGSAYFTANNLNCYIAGSFDARYETTICPFHFYKLEFQSPYDPGWWYVAKINQNTNIPFQANIYTPAIPDNFLCAGNTIQIPFVYCTNATSSFGLNNVFNAELSNSAGNFDSNVVQLGPASSAFIPLSVKKGNNYHVRVVSTDPPVIGDVNSNGFYNNNISIDPIKAEITNVSPVSLCLGDTIFLNALVADSSKHYAWYLNGINITSSYLYKLDVTTNGVYKLKVFNPSIPSCSVYSDSVQVNSHPKPSASIIASGPLTFCLGDSVILTTSAGNNYQWKKNNININGATGQNYTATLAGNYKVKVTNAFGCTKISNPKTVTVPCKDANELAIFTNASVFPNPFSSSVNLYFDNIISEKIEISIFDLTGRLCETPTIYTGQEDIILGSSLDNGIYLIEVTYGNMIQRLKVLKNKLTTGN